MARSVLPLLILSALLAGTAAAQSTLVLNPPAGVAPKNQHVVLLSGDEEYRSEESLPMLAKILSQRHGYRTTVLFALDPDGTINPDNQQSLPGSEALATADVIIMALRFRNWPDAAMQQFVDAYLRGVPLIALRTSTHPFNFPPDSQWARYSWNSAAPWPGGFGKHVLGETWVSHWGRHKVEATRAVIEPAAEGEPLLRGVSDVFGNSDVYEAYPPADARILLRGLVLKGMSPDDPPADYTKKRKTDQQEQGVNAPAMPVAWTRLHRNEAGRENRILTTTLGAATDLQNEGLRRLIVNGVYWALGSEVPARADVRPVDPYTPLMYGFKGYRIGLRPADYALGRTVPEGTPRPPPRQPAAAAGATTAESGFVPLFNGRDLTGWEGLRGFWSVRDGAITGRTTADQTIAANTFLVWQGGTPADFELRLSVRLTAQNDRNQANSGIQYRSRVLDAATYSVGGYQADFDSAGRYAGMLYEERGRGIVMQPGERIVIHPAPGTEKPRIERAGEPTGAAALAAAYRPGEWNDFVIRAQGNRLRHFINGVLTADVTDLDAVRGAKSGVIALQLHTGPPMTVQFRDVRLKPLDN